MTLCLESYYTRKINATTLTNLPQWIAEKDERTYNLHKQVMERVVVQRGHGALWPEPRVDHHVAVPLVWRVQPTVVGNVEVGPEVRDLVKQLVLSQVTDRSGGRNGRHFRKTVPTTAARVTNTSENITISPSREMNALLLLMLLLLMVLLLMMMLAVLLHLMLLLLKLILMLSKRLLGDLMKRRCLCLGLCLWTTRRGSDSGGVRRTRTRDGRLRLHLYRLGGRMTGDLHVG